MEPDDTDARCTLYVSRDGGAFMRAATLAIEGTQRFTPSRLSRTCYSQSRRVPTAKPTKLRAWVDDGDTMALTVDGSLANGMAAAISLSDFVRPELLDRGPTVSFLVRGGDDVLGELTSLVEPILEPMSVRQGAIDVGDGVGHVPFFPTVEPAGQFYSRYHPEIYDNFVIGYDSDLVWLGSEIRTRLPLGGLSTAERGWFAPTPDLLGDTWPTIAGTRPYMELIQHGAVVPWTTELE